MSLSAVMQDPSTLLEALPVLMNFHLQFDVTTSIYLQPMVRCSPPVPLTPLCLSLGCFFKFFLFFS